MGNNSNDHLGAVETEEDLAVCDECLGLNDWHRTYCSAYDPNVDGVE